MSTRQVIIRRFALGPLFQWGFVAGVMVACLPAFLCSWVLFTFVQALRSLIASWRDVGFDVLGQRISFNLVETLNLQPLLQTLTSLTGLGVFGIFVLAIALAALLGIFGALVLVTLGVFYNTTGRLELELEDVTPRQAHEVIRKPV